MSNISGQRLRHGGMFGILPVLSTGFVDGFNPCFLTAILILFLYLSFVGQTVRRFTSAGKSYIAGFVVVVIVAYSGLVDQYAAITEVQIALYGSQIVMGVILILIALVTFYDWISFRQHNDASKFIIKFPEAIFSSSLEKEDGVSRSLIFGSFGLGCLMGFWASAWPPNLSSDFLLAEFINRQSSGKMMRVIVVYSWAMTFSMILFYTLASHSLRSGWLKSAIEKYVSSIKIMFSAVSMALGIGLFYIFY